MLDIEPILKKVISSLKKQVFTTGLSKKSLVFIDGNAKLKDIYTFSLPAGWTCPGAQSCLAKVNRKTGKLSDGENTIVRCFSASEEAVYTAVRQIRWHNYDLLQKCKSVEELTSLICGSIPTDAKIIRIHVSGDFYNLNYFQAWVNAAKQFPNIVFYAYTKSVNFYSQLRSDLPSNFKVTCSLGSRYDNLTLENNFKFAKIVLSPEEAQMLNLEVDTDDSHAYTSDESFALVVHGTQPKNSDAGRAWSKQLVTIKLINLDKNKNKIKKVKKQVTVYKQLRLIVTLSCRLVKLHFCN
jgi:hypothetical protein